ncbi:MAG: PEP-CTERM sorting domain-containing protein [Planctomycetota bacterium]
MKPFSQAFMIAAMCAGLTAPATLAQPLFDEAVSGDIEDTDLGDLGPGRNTVLGSVDSTLTGNDNFTFNVPTGRQLVGGVLDVSINDSSTSNADVSAALLTPDEEDLAFGTFSRDGRFVLPIADPQMPLPQPAGNGYGGFVALTGLASGASADYDLSLITAGPTKRATLDPGPVGSTFEDITLNTNAFNGDGFNGDGFVFNADFGGKAIEYTTGLLFIQLGLQFEDDPFDNATLDAEALSARLIGTDGFDDFFVGEVGAGSGDTNTPGVSTLLINFFDDSTTGGPPAGFTFSGIEILGLLPTDANAVINTELRIGTEFGTPTSFTVVPEPATLALLALGGVTLLRRSR